MNNYTDIQKEAKWRRFTQFPKLKNVLFARGPAADRGMDMCRAVNRQKAPRFAKGLLYKIYGREGLRDYHARMAKRFVERGLEPGGTVVGKQIYLDAWGLKPGVLREFLVHEKFHTLPFIGQSEILAHIAGGLGSKGSVGHKLKRATGNYLDLWLSRPTRAVFEHGLIGGVALGGISLAKKKKDKEEINE